MASSGNIVSHGLKLLKLLGYNTQKSSLGPELVLEHLPPISTPTPASRASVALYFQEASVAGMRKLDKCALDGEGKKWAARGVCDP